MKWFHRKWAIQGWTQLTWINAFPGKDLGSPESRWQSSTTGRVGGAPGLKSRSSDSKNGMGYLLPLARGSTLGLTKDCFLP